MQGNKEVWGYVRPNNTFTWRWNPMKSWDQWRVVEEKVMEDEELFMDYTLAIWNAPPDGYCCKKQVAADLPTRCKALVSILPKNEDE